MPISSDEADLLEGIRLAELDDTLPRLVYADWLEEHGETEQAAFIRLSCDMAFYSADRAKKNAWTYQQRQWLEDLPEDEEQLVTCLHFHLGLPFGLNFNDHSGIELYEQVESEVERENVLDLLLDRLNFESGLARYANYQLREMHLNLDRFSNELLETLTYSEKINRFDSWNFYKITSEFEKIRRLLMREDFAPLHTLRLLELAEDKNPEASLKSIRKFFSIGSFESVTNLSIVDIETDDFELFPREISFPSVRQLKLRNVCEYLDLYGPLLQKHLPQLNYLDVSDNRNYSHLISWLRESNPPLDTLYMNRCNMGTSDIDRLNDCSFVENLTTLSLCQNNIDKSIIQTLFGSQRFQNLEWLDLSFNDIQSVGARWLLKNNPSPKLRFLNLSHNSITPNTIQRLKDSPAFNQCTILG